jgi:hypothetical protein
MPEGLLGGKFVKICTLTPFPTQRDVWWCGATIFREGVLLVAS